jgi:hypothetical protein
MRIGRRISFSKPVHWAANASRTTVEDMSLDHCRLDIAVAQKLLDCPDVISGFEQEGGERIGKTLGILD